MHRAFKVFISGPMTGYKAFNKAAFELTGKRQEVAGCTVVSPIAFDEKILGKYFYTKATDNSEFDSDKLRELVVAELDALEECDAIYLLPGWQHSEGARRELKAALLWNKVVLTQADSLDADYIQQYQEESDRLQGIQKFERELLAQFMKTMEAQHAEK